MQSQLRPLWEHLPQLPIEERDRRWHAVRQAMEQQGIDALVIFKSGLRGEHVRYLTQLLLHNSGAVIFPLKGEPTVFTDALHIGKYAQACSTWVKDVREDFEHFPEHLRSLGLDNGIIGLVGGLRAHTRLRREAAPAGYPIVKATLPDARIVDATATFETLEMIKAPAEIEMLQKAAEIAYEVFEAIGDAARPGATEAEVYAAMLHAQTARGGDVDSIYLEIGSPPMLHGRLAPFTLRTLQPGDIVITEYHTSYAGYLIAAEHSFSLGEPDPGFRRLHATMEQCFHEGMASMTVGTPFSEVIGAYRAPADRNGMAYVELGIHGHGLGSCEPPTTVFGGRGGILHDHFLGQVPDTTLQDGMVFGQNIDVHDPSFNPNAGLMLGDTIWVTKGGPRKMTRIPAELTVL